MEKTVQKDEVRRLAVKKSYYADVNTPVADQKEGFKVKSYFQFVYGKSVFNVHEDDEFIQKWDGIKEIKIDITEEGASLISFRTRKSIVDDAMFEGDLDYARNRYKYQAQAGKLTIANLEETADL
jgi:hypothetical protein